MARRSRREKPESLRKKLIQLLEGFEEKLQDDDLRDQVTSLVPANFLLRDLGSSLIKDESATSARERILSYLRKYPAVLLQGSELMVVAGIGDYPRRIRELRVEHGWPILSGQALRAILEDGEVLNGVNSDDAKTDTYILLADEQDRDSAYRWNIANEIRKRDTSVKNKVLAYLRENVGQKVTGEELKYLAKDASEWARRVRELRTEDGWPVATRVSGRPELSVGVYILEEDRQAETHDRKIPDPIRVSVLERDKYSCRCCNWSHENRKEGDKLRNLLELHHVEHHAEGGANTEGNLITLCNICHDNVHRGGIDKDKLLSYFS
ncbi:MAG: HNH endonuclease [Gammaproteobacteria bacterium]|nr:HNH endonuclease [Gammaproteobacteria bacterium]MBQ0840064.1 HNH endonuclease [Gammaproteobacteria bacterium]